MTSPAALLPNEFSFHDGHRLGLREVPAVRAPRILMRDYLAEVPIPQTVNHISEVPTWCMGGNNRFGTCGPTSLANDMILAYRYLLGMDISVADAAVFDLYRRSGNPTFNPATGAGDGGVDMYTMLLAAVKGGLTITHPDGTPHLIKPVAIAEVDSSDIAEAKAVTALMGGVECGVILYTVQQTQTGQGLWDYITGSSQYVWGGHAVMGASYSGALTGADESVISWQEPVATTDRFMANQNQQSFAVILPIHMSNPGFLTGANTTAMVRDFQAITEDPAWQ